MFKKAHVLVGIWALVMLAAILVLSAGKVTSFDPNNALYDISVQPGFDKTFEKKVSQLIGGRNSSVVIFVNGSCFCETMSKPHIGDIEAKAASSSVNIVTVDISDTALNEIIPSTPAAAVFDMNGSLSYLGPLSTGAFCTGKGGLVESFIKQDFVRSLPGASILLETSGCYCNTRLLS